MSGPFGSSQWMYSSGASGFYDFPITKSLRFNDGDSAYLGFTPSSAGNRRTWTWSSWVKLSNLGTAKTLFGSGTASSNDNTLDHTDGSIFYFYDRVAAKLFLTDAVYRDPSAWYNVVFVADTTNSTAGDRLRLFVNGVRQDGASGSDYPDQNTDLGINNNVTHFIGARKRTNIENFYDGYLAETCLIDGTALAPSSFGETKNDIWIPKNTSGLTFGDQGWRLQYKQTGTGTASSSTIGADTSGEDNHWTSNNLVASDVVPDSPTNNFGTLNSLARTALNSRTLSEGNLKYQATGDDVMLGNFGISSGKHYFEIYVNDIEGTNNLMGIALASSRNFDNSVHYRSGSGEIVDALADSTTQTGITNAANGNIVALAVDLDGGSVQFKLNNSNLGNAVSLQSGTYIAIIGNGNSSISGAKIFTFNFGQDSAFAGAATAQNNADGNGIGDFYYAPPSGFLAMCTSNMTAPVATIDPAEGGSVQDYFNTVLYTGTGGTQSISVGFQPDFTWNKQRSGTDFHALQNSVAGPTKILVSNNNNAEATITDCLTAFTSTGFTLGADSSGYGNENTQTYASWNWKVGGSSSVNTDGTDIDSTGLFNTDLGMSIVTYTGTGSSGDSYGHGLDKAPELVLVKDRTDPANWAVYSVTTGLNGYLRLNDTNTKTDDSNIFPSVSATTIGVGTQGDGSIANTSGDSYVSYNFHSVDGYSKIGSYIGNESANGPFVYTGFRPAFLMTKKTSATSNWIIKDNKRDASGGNVITTLFKANDTSAEETTASMYVDFLSNGFKLRGTSTTTNEGTIIYMAFAEQPFKYSNAR